MTNSPTSIDNGNIQNDLANAREALVHAAMAFDGICDFLADVYQRAGFQIEAFGAGDIARERLQSIENSREGLCWSAGALNHLLAEVQSFTDSANKLN